MQEDKGVLSAYQSLYNDDKEKHTIGLLLTSDPRYYEYQLILNSFGCSGVAVLAAIPVDLLCRPWRELKPSLRVLATDTAARQQAFGLGRSIVTHSTIKHMILLYSYERLKVFISNEKGINGLWNLLEF